MLLFFKNKGYLVPLLLVGFSIGALIINGIISELYSFLNFNIFLYTGTILILTGLFSYIIDIKDIKDKNKTEKNTLYFIPMNIWGVILIIIGSATYILGYINLWKSIICYFFY